MVRIAVVDDDGVYLRRLQREITSYFGGIGMEIELFVFDNGRDILLNSLKCSFDIIFLDIDMPELTGLETANKIRKYNNNVILIFVSNMERFVFESIKCAPFRFVRKWMMEDELPEVLEALAAKMSKDRMYFRFSCNGEQHEIRLADIVYFESFKHNIVLHSISGKQYNVQCTLDRLQSLYEPYGFIRTHKSYIVNYRYVYELNKTFLVLDNSEVIPLSRQRNAKVKLQYAHFTREDIQ